MNIASMIVSPIINKRKGFTPLLKIGIGVLGLIHTYIYLSFICIVVLICYACKIDNFFIKGVLWLISAIISFVLTWTAYVQANNKLKDADVRPYESVHVAAVGINAILSSVGFFVLAIFPKLIFSFWPWVENLTGLVFTTSI